MKVILLTPHYIPDGGPSAPLFTMLSEELVRLGHTITVITAVPHYPTGYVQEAFSGQWLNSTVENGVNVVRVAVPSIDRARFAPRLFQLLCYQLGAIYACLTRSCDVVIASNPFLSTGLPFVYLSAIRRKPAVFSVHDVYPDVGITLGVFRHKAIIDIIRIGEQFCLKQASYVRILSESFRNSLNKLGVPDSKLSLIYDWVDTNLIHPLPRNNAFALEHELVSKFVVLYAGNIGLSQGLEHVIAAAELLAEQKDVLFMFVGDGAGRNDLVERVAQKGLTNVQFLPFQPRSRLPEVLASADISLVTLQKGVGIGSLPSKSFSIFASGRPLLASVDEGSDIWNLIVRAKAGICVPPEDPKRVVEAIIQLKVNQTQCRCLGENGRQYALQHHSPKAAAERFEQLLMRAVKLKKGRK